MHPIKRFRVAKWYVKALVILILILMIPAMFLGFLFVTTWFRWQSEREDLVSNVERYNRFIKAAEQGRSKVVMRGDGKRGVGPTRIYDRHGTLIGEFLTEQREVVPYNTIPELLKKAIIAMEDTEFWRHNGINLRRMLHALYKTLIGHRTMGGSTITQQLAKLLFTHRQRTIQRKMFEFFGAKYLEGRFKKRDILTMYLNTVYFGFGAWGVEPASRLYFNKSVRMLNVYESALLAGILSRPGDYSPMKDINAAKRKHIQALSRMIQLGYVPRTVLNEDFERFWADLEQKLSSPSISIWRMKVNKAPYFIEFVRQQLRRYFKDDEIFQGGLKVYTTLDLSMQNNAREAVQNGLTRVENEKEKDIKNWLNREKRQLEFKLKKVTDPLKKNKLLDEFNKRRKEFLEKHSKPIEGALVSMDASNGYVLSMIGGKSFTHHDYWNRAIKAQRQFGSSMKPAVYATAIEQGVVTPSTVIDDRRRYYNDHGRVWSPHNFGHTRFGKITIRKALAFSVNTVAVETVFRLGPAKVAAKLNKIFFYKRHFPAILSLPLGSVELSPLEGAQIFACLASGGYRVKPLFIRRILDSENKVLYDFETAQAIHRAPYRNPQDNDSLPDTLRFDDDNALRRSDTSLVFDPRAVYLVTSMMQDVMNFGTGAYARNAARFYLNCAGKSGTSDKVRDAWFSGFVRNVVAVVWVGFDDDKTSLPRNMTGGIAAGPIWAEFMKRSQWAAGAYTFPRPGGLVERSVCKESGLLANENCPSVKKGLFLEGKLPDFCQLPHDKSIRKQEEQNESKDTNF